MMYIKKVLKHSKNDQEADVYITDGKYCVLSYVFPAFKKSIYSPIKSLYAFMCSDIRIQVNETFTIKKIDGYYSYYLIAQVVSSKESIVKIGDILICLDKEIPKDILDNQFVSFKVLRLDVIFENTDQ